MSSILNRAILQILRRAERNESDALVSTFVSAGLLFDFIVTKDNQILYGRRGTGKTHVLKYLAEERQKVGDLAVYIDLRTVGSNSSIYQDIRLPIAERGTRLLCDVLEYLYNSISAHVYSFDYSSNAEFSHAQEILEQFRLGIFEVHVSGEQERTEMRQDSSTHDAGGSISVNLSMTPSAQFALSDSQQQGTQSESTTRIVGPIRHRVHFGTISQALQELISGFPPHVWLLLDEWSDVPLDLQPLLADLLRRCVMTVQKVTVKIGAIEMRSNFIESDGVGGYIGFELGADIFADMKLDDFMVFGNDRTKAKSFFADLLFRHVHAILSANGDTAVDSPSDFVLKAFTQQDAFDELVRAGEGIPRDAMNIAMLAAMRAGDSRISITNIRLAARDWYQGDKKKPVQINPDAVALLNWIIEEVIGVRKARGFLLEQGEPSQHDLISALYDARVIHVTKRGIASQDRSEARYDAYVLDFGCYVDLTNTSSAPRGLFEVTLESGQEKFVDVPTDDYRSIRRAILDLNRFETRGRV